MIFEIINYIQSESFARESEGISGEYSFLNFDVHSTHSQKAIFFVFDQESTYPKYVIKYPKNRYYQNILHNDFEKYKSIYDRFTPDLKSFIPSPISLYEDGEMCAIIEKGVPGTSIANLVRLNINKNKIIYYLKKSLEFLFNLQNETKLNKKVDDEYIYKHIDMPLSMFVKRFNTNSKVKKMLNGARDEIVSYLKDKSCLVLSHGDYWWDNILAHNDKIYVIDWTMSRNCYFHFWDYFNLTTNVVFKDKKRHSEFIDLKDYYFRKAGIDPYIEEKIKIVYLAMRSVYYKSFYGIDNYADDKWKSEFDKVLDV